MKIRLDKYLADMKTGTRSEVKRLISKGKVTVNDQIAGKSDLKIDISRDIICCEGTQVSYVEFEYYMLNKPAGVVSAVKDTKDQTVVELIGESRRKDLFPVGRLDKDTEGLLLITNDGVLAHQLLMPGKHVDKVYFARVRGEVDEKDEVLFRTGLDIGEKKITLPAKLKVLTCGSESEVELTIQEGKFHQVKRMFQAVGKEVLYLKRLKMGTLVLDEHLRPGEYRKLTEKEIEKLC